MSPSSLLFLFFLLPRLSTSSSIYSFVYVACSQQKFTPNTPYEYNVDSALASLVNSATSSTFNNFKLSVPGSTNNDVVYSLFQCRGDLDPSDCHTCVSRAVNRLGANCGDSAGGGIQLEGCYVKYDSIPFLGVVDKEEVVKKCGPSIGYDPAALTRRDAVMGYLSGDSGVGRSYFRIGGTGNLQGMTQCVQDLSVDGCQDCLGEAIGRLRSECGAAKWGDVYLGKCYARYSEHGVQSRGDDKLSPPWCWWLFVGYLFMLI